MCQDRDGSVGVEVPSVLSKAIYERQSPLTMFLLLMLRIRQMRSRISCTGTDTGAPNSELENQSKENLRAVSTA